MEDPNRNPVGVPIAHFIFYTVRSMAKLTFTQNDAPTVGIEVELGLVDAETLALTSSINQLLEKLPEEARDSYKPELMQCFIEVNTCVCHTIDQAKNDLIEKLRVLEMAADSIGVNLWWGATHPFSRWREQSVTPTERYLNLIELLQEMARRLVTFGLHVHVGVDSGDKAIMICDRIMQHLPTLLAVSCSSPFWDERQTGLQSFRSKIMEGLPTAGLPPLMRNWSEYVWLVTHMVETEFINTIREIWWDVRPHHNFGTVEVRVCDMPGNLDDALAISALVQCLVKALSDLIDQGAYQHDCHPIMVQQNKWRAARYGNKARLVNSFTFESHSTGAAVNSLADRLMQTAEDLGCVPYLDHIRRMAAGPSWSDRQMAILKQTGDPREVVRQMLEESKLERSESVK